MCYIYFIMLEACYSMRTRNFDYGLVFYLIFKVLLFSYFHHKWFHFEIIYDFKIISKIILLSSIWKHIRILNSWFVTLIRFSHDWIQQNFKIYRFVYRFVNVPYCWSEVMNFVFTDTFIQFFLFANFYYFIEVLSSNTFIWN